MIIPIAQFNGQKNPNNPLTTISVECVDDFGQTKYYFLAENGNRSMCYRSISQAVLDITDIYGKCCGFKILMEAQK